VHYDDFASKMQVFFIYATIWLHIRSARARRSVFVATNPGWSSRSNCRTRPSGLISWSQWYDPDEMRRTLVYPLLFAFVSGSFAVAQNSDATGIQVKSPDGQVVFLLSGGPRNQARGPSKNDLHYSASLHGKLLVDDSALGLKLEGQPVLGSGMHRVNAQTSQHDQTYTIPVGKTSSVRDHYNSTVADFEDGAGRKLSIEIRAYDDGVAFRYVVPAQPNLGKVRIEHELTEFTFAKDASLYPLIVDGFQSSYEDDYQMRPVSGIHPDWLIALPLLAEIPGSGWVGVTEADIENYAGMYLRKARARFGLRAELSPRIDDHAIAVEADAPVSTPWRVLMVGDEPGRLIESNMVLNLNPPSKIADTSWIKAGKSAWDWWSGEAAPSLSTKPGMNTATMKH
jgi:alpha-glucosidase